MDKVHNAVQENQSAKQSASSWKEKTVGVLTVVNLLIAALNGFAGYWGFTSAKSISDLKAEAEKSSAEAKKASQEVTEIKETAYYYCVKEIERDVELLVKELPSPEFIDESTKKLKEELQQCVKRIESLETGFPENKRSDKKFLVKGILEFDRRNYDGAIVELQKVQDQIPEKYYILGAAYSRRNDLDMAQQMFVKVREFTRLSGRNTLLARANAGEGIILIRRNNIAGAIDRYKDAIRNDPDLLEAYYGLSAAYSRNENYEMSIRYLCEFKKRAATDVFREIETDPDDAFADLKRHLGTGWKEILASRLESCN